MLMGCTWGVFGGHRLGTFGVEAYETVAERPFFHSLVENDVLGEDGDSDVLKPAQPLQDLGHGLGVGFLHHAADSHYDLPLHGLQTEEGQLLFKAPPTLVLHTAPPILATAIGPPIFARPVTRPTFAFSMLPNHISPSHVHPSFISLVKKNRANHL